MRIAGIVLAGGRSSRFGRDKALAVLHAQPLIHWSVEALRDGAEVLAINGPMALCDRVGLPRAPDAPGVPAGPLAGVLGAMGWAAGRGCSHLLTAPCDTPFLPPDMGARLALGIGEGPAIAARAARAHPLCALWRVDLAPALATLAAAPDQPSLQAIIKRLGGSWLDFPDEAAFANLNTPAEFEQAERRFAG
jgi:molybdopterin-guanine dinucleotide biosynthesis protein A